MFSDSDVALVIKYQFHDFTEEVEQSKKRKLTKISNVIDYSNIKLPAVMFGQYLDNDAGSFIENCQR